MVDFLLYIVGGIATVFALITIYNTGAFGFFKTRTIRIIVVALCILFWPLVVGIIVLVVITAIIAMPSISAYKEIRNFIGGETY